MNTEPKPIDERLLHEVRTILRLLDVDHEEPRVDIPLDTTNVHVRRIEDDGVFVVTVRGAVQTIPGTLRGTSYALFDDGRFLYESTETELTDDEVSGIWQFELPADQWKTFLESMSAQGVNLDLNSSRVSEALDMSVALDAEEEALDESDELGKKRVRRELSSLVELIESATDDLPLNDEDLAVYLEFRSHYVGSYLVKSKVQRAASRRFNELTKIAVSSLLNDEAMFGDENQLAELIDVLRTELVERQTS